MTAPMTHAHAARPIVEAPPEIEEILAHWCPDGSLRYATNELTMAMQKHRGVRLLTEHHVLWLAKASDRQDDVIMVMARSMPLRGKQEQAPTGS